MESDPIGRKPIEIDVLLELRDYLRANYWFLFRRFRLMIILLFFAAFIYPILSLSGAMGEQSSPTESNWGFLIPGLILLVLIASVYFGSRKSLASNRSLQETIHYTFAESGIHSQATSSSGHQAWENFREAFETSYNFLLFPADRLMYVIPKRCFDDAVQIKEFKEVLLNKLGSKAKLSK